MSAIHELEARQMGEVMAGAFFNELKGMNIGVDYGTKPDVTVITTTTTSGSNPWGGGDGSYIGDPLPGQGPWWGDAPPMETHRYPAIRPPQVQPITPPPADHNAVERTLELIRQARTPEAPAAPPAPSPEQLEREQRRDALKPCRVIEP